MKRQDDNGENTLHVDGTGGGGTDVNIAEVGGTPVTSPLPVTGTLTPSGTFDENLAQVNGDTVNVGAGAAGTGTQRVITATDSTIGTVTAVTAITNALPAGSNVIGHVITDTGSTTAVTGNVTVVQPTGTNLHTVVDSGTVTVSGTVAVTQSTSPWIVAGGGTAGTAATGVVSVQGIASMTPVQVSQATASSLNATVVGAAASGATKAGNPVQVGGVFNTTQPTVTNGQAVEAQATARGALIVAPGVDGFAVTNAALNPALSVTFLQVTASGDTTLLASGTRKIRRVEMSNSHATTALTAGLKVASLNSGAVFAKKYLPAAGGLGVTTFGQGYLQTTSETTVVNLSVAGTVEVTIYYE